MDSEIVANCTTQATRYYRHRTETIYRLYFEFHGTYENKHEMTEGKSANFVPLNTKVCLDGEFVVMRRVYV